MTNRRLCDRPFLEQVESIAAGGVQGIILREKDLPEEEYALLAEKVMEICRYYQTRCILHTFADTAISLHAREIHLPLPVLRSLPEEKKKLFSAIGASCHSLEDAKEAQSFGCTYLTLGHIFETDCKKGLPGRGLGLLKTVCDCVSLPVYAIGGIKEENLSAVRQAGAKGVCIMSGLMKCRQAEKSIHLLKKAWEGNELYT